MANENNIQSDRNTAKELIKTPVTLTNAYQDIGDKIITKGLLNIGLWLKGELNDSDIISFRCKCFPTKESTDVFYTQIQTVSSIDVGLKEEIYTTNQSTISLVVPLGISQLAPYIQIEAKVGVAGATPAEIEKALLTFERESR